MGVGRVTGAGVRVSSSPPENPGFKTWIFLFIKSAPYMPQITELYGPFGAFILFKCYNLPVKGDAYDESEKNRKLYT